MNSDSQNKISHKNIKKSRLIKENSGDKRRNLSGMTRDQAHQNLKILSQLKPGEKLTINENDTLLLDIESIGLITSINRYKTGISRYTVTLPICLTIDRISSDENFDVDDIKNIKNGLEILKNTYKNDDFKQLDCLIYRVENIIKHSGSFFVKQKLNGIVDYWIPVYKSSKFAPEDFAKDVDRKITNLRKKNIFKRIRLWFMSRKIKKNNKQLKKISDKIEQIEKNNLTI